jgi:hypothetical protein
MIIPGLSIRSFLTDDTAATVYDAEAADGRAAILVVGRWPLDAHSSGYFNAWAAALVAAAQHSALADVLGQGLTTDGHPYLATLTLPRTLADGVLGGTLPPTDLLRATAVQLAGALAALHDHGLVHGAVRPATVLVTDEWDALLAGYDMTAPGIATALPPDGYTAPERLPPESAPPSMAADVYELAATLYVFAGGLLPWLAGDDATASNPARRAVPLADPPGVVGPFPDALRKALAPDSANRPTAAVFRDALQAAPAWSATAGEATAVPSAALSFAGRPASRSANVSGLETDTGSAMNGPSTDTGVQGVADWEPAMTGGGSDVAPSAGSPAASRRRRWLVLMIVLALLVGVGGTVAVLYSFGAFSTEIRAEPIQTTGDNPFAPPVGTDQANTTSPRNTGRTVSGDISGLYGGTLNISSCDPEKLVAFLQSNPDKAAAWASVEGISPAEIPRYVAELTPVILRSDTAVTNHGFARGKTTTLRSVLQAGTAVLVDKLGVPRVRCMCGNPLTAPQSFSKQRYVGPTWPQFNQTNITIIQPAPQVISQFTVVNPVTNVIFYRPAGTRGDRDVGRLEDASLAGTYTIVRTVVTCVGFKENCSTSPIPVEVSCSSSSQCTIARLDGVWVQSHPMSRNGNTWTTSDTDAGASFCEPYKGGPQNPRPGTQIKLELTPTSAATTNGVWRVQGLKGSYTVEAAAVPGTDCGVGTAVYDLSV